MKTLGAVLTMLVLLAPQAALATVQIPDNIYIEGQKHFLFSTLLEQYWGVHHPRLRWPCTATWRGYIATWEIDGGALYLKAIRAWTPEGEVGLEALFPGHKGRVTAAGFTGQLKVPQGQAPHVPYAPPHLLKRPHDHRGPRPGDQTGTY